MRSAVGFLSLLAFGFLAAGVMTVIGSGPDANLSIGSALDADQSGLHLGSLLLGLVLGLVLSALARVHWTELPRRFVGWLLTHERNFYRVALAGVFLGVLLYY